MVTHLSKVLIDAITMIISKPDNLHVQVVQRYLNETNVRALLSEALTADVEAILADQPGFVSADATV